MAILVLLLASFLIKTGFSQPNNTENNNTNTPIRSFCGRIPPINLAIFINNRNLTFNEIRRQLSSSNKTDVYYARAQSLAQGDSVFGLAQCRNRISAAQCVACFDAGMSELDTCITVNGAYTFFDNCYLRYANYDDFYNNPYVVEDVGITPLGICGNQSASQPTFSQDVDGLLSDIKVATPQTSNFYVASTTQITSDNATVYAIAWCVENINKGICQDCINIAYTNLYNCLPSTEARFLHMGCFARYSVTPFFNDNQTVDITNLLKGDSSKLPVIVGAIGGVALLIVMIVVWLLFRRLKKSKKIEEDVKGAGCYSYKDLKLATNNFTEENLIGKGGFGEVFKAIVDNGIVVAVKKLHVGLGSKKEFENEVNLNSNIRHRNLIQQLGWCNDGPELLLVLEYMPKGSLDKFLWGEKKGTLNWKQRSDIILGIARGLVHLHEEFHFKIIHRDIKSSNILLDNDFQPKVADFGLARFLPEDQTHVSTGFAGTMGYTAPEYATRGRLSEKVDTYSFGIVALEVISGRSCSDVKYNGPQMEYLLDDAWKLYEKGMHMKLIDEAIDPNEYQEQNVKKIIEIALRCTQPVSLRPTMSETYIMLSSEPQLEQRQMCRPTFNDLDRRIHIGES